MPSGLLLRPVVSAFASALLTASSCVAFQAPLSPESQREAYFLGQHRDKSTAEFLSKYQRTFAMPKSGLYVSEIELFTPYAEAVDLSRQRSFSYSAQQAEEDYRKRGDVVRLRVRVWFTDTYSRDTYAQSRASRSEATAAESFPRTRRNSPGVQVLLRQNDKTVDQLEMPGIPVYRGYTEGDVYYGFDIVLHYAAQDLTSDPAEVVVLTPDGQRVTASFDLASLL